MDMNEQMSLDEFKKKVRDCLMNLNTPQEHIETLMKDCEEDILDTYKTSCEPLNVALPMSMNLI